MSSGPPSSRRDWTPVVSVALALLTTWGAMAAAWGALKERTDTLREQYRTQTHVDEKHDTEIDALKNSRAVEKEISRLTERVAALEATLKQALEQGVRKRR